MGQNKALLPFGKVSLLAWMAERVQAVCGQVSLVGQGIEQAGGVYPVVEDIFAGQGPLAGIHTVFTHSDAPFNLVVACDMPYLTSEFLSLLLQIAQGGKCDAVVPESEGFGDEPLCAVYTPACQAPIEKALQDRQPKTRGVLDRLRVRRVTRQEWQPYDSHGKLFCNLNTPEDYHQAYRELIGHSRTSFG